MTRVTYHDVHEAAPVVTFHGVRFEHNAPVDVPDDWSGLEAVGLHPHFKVDGKKAQDPEHEKAHLVPPAEPPQNAISVAEARKAGREAYASGHHRQSPAHFSRPLKRAWDEGFDRARRQAKGIKRK